MPNSWDNYFAHYADWDDSHCFNVRLELKFEDKLKSLGYVENLISEELYLPENNFKKYNSDLWTRSGKLISW